jgi:hypothetical protein
VGAEDPGAGAQGAAAARQATPVET